MQRWSPADVTAFSPVLSADNKTIVFGRSGCYGSYSPIAQPHLHAWRFHASDLDGTNVRQLTNESFYSVSPASVSPDGKCMAVMTEGFDAHQQIAIYPLARPGPSTRSLKAHIPKEADHKNPIVDFPNYMPDGKSLLFMAASNGKLPWSEFDYDVYRLDIETGAVERLTQGNGYASGLKVSADGKPAAAHIAMSRRLVRGLRLVWVLGMGDCSRCDSSAVPKGAALWQALAPRPEGLP
jgi:Tol biopolymer transport system component